MPALVEDASRPRSLRLHSLILEKGIARAAQLGISTSVYVASMARAATIGIDSLDTLAPERISKFARAETSLSFSDETWRSLATLARARHSTRTRVIESLISRELSSPRREFVIWPTPKSPKPGL